jgi:hypothetical protein
MIWPQRLLPGTSAAVIIRTTPGALAASAVSMRRMRAWTWSL